MNNAPRILIVDDEEEFTQHLAWLLKDSYNLEVDVACTGEKALEMIKKTHYDLLVTDVHMPGMDGMELTLKVRENNPDQDVIVMTGYPTREYPDGVINLGSITYLVKPFHVDRLMELVRKILNLRRCEDGEQDG